MENKKNREWLLLLSVICVAATLRAPITAVGPLIASMRASMPFSSGVLGLLTTIPLVMFAVVSPFVRKLSDTLGAGKTLLYSVCVIALGIALRSYAGLAGLFAGTVLLGVGIAIGNVLVPGVIKARFPAKVGLGTSAFTLSMTSLAALSSAVSYPLSKLPGVGWKNSLAVWLVLALVGVIAWWPHRELVTKPQQQKLDNAPEQGQSEPAEVQRSVFRSPMAWWLTLLMGAQSFLFYFFTAWLPTIAQYRGVSPETAGYIAFAFQLSTIPAAFVIPTIASRLKDQRSVITMVAVLYLGSLCVLFFASSTGFLAIAVMLYGFATGSCFNLCMLLISLRTRSAARATSLSGMVQSLGYGFGAIGPILGGWLFDLTGNWNAAFACVALLIVTIFFSGRKAGRNLYI